MTYQLNFSPSKSNLFIRLIIFPSVLVFSLFACRKDKTESLLDEYGCTKIIRCKKSVIGPRHIRLMNYPLHSDPAWNPTNPNEILYTKIINGNFNQVVLHNIITGEKKIIIQGTFFLSFNDVQDDWILILNSDYQVYKIKIDGTGLTQLTHTAKYYAPKFYHEIGKFYVQDLSLSNQLVLIQMDGTILDTLPSTQVLKGPFLNDRFLFCHYLNQKIYIKGLNGEIQYEYDYSFQNPITDPNELSGGATWIDENNIMYGHNGGNFILNLPTNQSKKIHSQCPMLYYPLTSNICSNGSQLLQSECTLEQPDECTLIYSSHIFLTDLDGNNRVYINYRD